MKTDNVTYNEEVLDGRTIKTYQIFVSEDEDAPQVEYEFEDETEDLIEDAIIEGDNMKQIHFIDQVIDLGETKFGEAVSISFKYEGDHTAIKAIKPACGCTTNLVIDDVNKTLVGVFSTSESGIEAGSYIKKINVFLHNDKEIKVKNSLGIELPSNSARIQLQFKGKMI